MCAVTEGASIKEKVRHSVRETTWYGVVLIYTALMLTLSVIFMATGVNV